MTAGPPYNLRALARLLGLQPRTIRHYIQEGLVAGPASGGRYAEYGQAHVERLRAVQILRDRRGMRLQDIRRYLLSLDDEQIRSLPAQGLPEQSGSAGSALAYLQSLGVASGVAAPPAALSSGAVPAAAALPVAGAGALRLEPRAAAGPAPRKARAAIWYRLPITPDLEFCVRGPCTEDELSRYERLAAQLRQQILGGATS
jgi:DNA-binding transcriptional MerR regulator